MLWQQHINITYILPNRVLLCELLRAPMPIPRPRPCLLFFFRP